MIFKKNNTRKHILPEDEFDRKFGFLVINGIVSEKNYLETKEFYFYLKVLKDI
jgi:hypothetical protein